MGDRLVDLWWSDLRSVDAGLFDVLDATEAERCRGIVGAADRGRFVLGVALLRVAVAAATGGDARSVVVDRTCSDCGAPHGAPQVDGARVSVAHAGPLVLVGTASEPVGVDVEAVDRGEDVAQWVLREAAFKTGLTGAGSADDHGARHDAGRPTVTTIHVPAPWPGHLAAVALAGDDEPRLRVHGLEESAQAVARLVQGSSAG